MIKVSTIAMHGGQRDLCKVVAKTMDQRVKRGDDA
jgi:hypothetical protein